MNIVNKTMRKTTLNSKEDRIYSGKANLMIININGSKELHRAPNQFIKIKAKLLKRLRHHGISKCFKANLTSKTA